MRTVSWRTSGGSTVLLTICLALLSVLLLAACEHDRNDGQHDQPQVRHDQHEGHEGDDGHEGQQNDRDVREGEREVAYWVAPMDPSYRRDRPGKSPMGMDLIPVYTDELSEPGQVRVGPGVQQAMNLRTAVVERNRLFRRIDTVGTIGVDESNLVHIHPRVEGWIGELDVESTGSRVTRGQRLYTLYSRELVNIQEELLQALRSDQPAMIRAARQRLEVLDVQPAVIERIERDRQVITYIPWHARNDGYVADLGIRRGMFVTPGTEMMIIADPTSVWVIAEVFGGQIDWLAEGQIANVERSSHPGERLRGRVDLIYPELAPVTRTAQVRIRLDDENGTLMPGDWASIAIFGGPRENLLIVPTEAIIRTGAEQRVIVQTDDQLFSVRQVHAGMASGRYTEIIHGLEEGERVVTSGQFLIDSEASIHAGHDRLGGQHDH
ncbi:MAG: efflux RND transporter periplasmic adaptor subunit [Wenzhouxiangella sp.]